MRSPHVLIVEDDESLGLALVDAFERDGYRVDHVIDGREALERGLARRFDLIVLDLMLPGMDGYEVCKRLRAAGRDSPILMLTARGREEDRVHGLDLGAMIRVIRVPYFGRIGKVTSLPAEPVVLDSESKARILEVHLDGDPAPVQVPRANVELIES